MRERIEQIRDQGRVPAGLAWEVLRDRDTALAELDAARAEVGRWQRHYDVAHATALVEIERLRGALGHYASDDNWNYDDRSGWCDDYNGPGDGYDIARAALAGTVAPLVNKEED